ncbi:MAG: LPS export ABC transporter periplasmic protein LptC [Spirochaetia bacterium]|nr:LPS export ABC transporter periplasmic protein LptC [Spirochaetia bacterium]
MRKTAIILIAAMIALSAAGCGNDKKIKPKLPVGGSIEDIPNFVIQGFKLSSTDKGVTIWEIEGKAAQVFELKKKIYVQDFLMKNYENATDYSTLTGKRAVVDTGTNFMEVTEHVRYHATNGMILKTEKLSWDDSKKMMFTDAEVIIIRDNSVLKGIGLESDAGMKNMVIKRQVKLTAKDIQNVMENE